MNNIEDHPVIKDLEEALAGPYGDILRLNPNGACELTYERLKGSPEWSEHSSKFSKHIYKRLFTDGVKERVYTKRYKGHM